VISKMQKRIILDNLINAKIKIEDCIFYSYWNNFMALTLSEIKTKNKNVICISKSHGWDIDYMRHNPKYLPFKGKILNKLDVTFTISSVGKKMMTNLFPNLPDHKIKVSYLGTKNSRPPLIKKNNSKLIICSCSVIYELKRLHLIVDIINHLKEFEIEWYHFGDGPLKNTVEKYANEKIPNVKFFISGMISNQNILNFYKNNFVDFFINVSEFEGVPVSIMEALSAGIPVIATNVGGVAEIVNKDTGFLIEKNFKTEIIAKIIKKHFCSSELTKERMRLECHAFWKRCFNSEINYNIFINEIINLNVKNQR
jgi:glycosyltransferase involved in cell wall biosynthesis